YVSRVTRLPSLHSIPTRRSSDLGAIRYFGTGADFGLSVLGRTAGVTLGAGSESALVRGTLLADESNNRSVASLYGRVNLSEVVRSEEHTSELQSRENLVCRLLLE